MTGNERSGSGYNAGDRRSRDASKRRDASAASSGGNSGYPQGIPNRHRREPLQGSSRGRSASSTQDLVNTVREMASAAKPVPVAPTSRAQNNLVTHSEHRHTVSFTGDIVTGMQALIDLHSQDPRGTFRGEISVIDPVGFNNDKKSGKFTVRRSIEQAGSNIMLPPPNPHNLDLVSRELDVEETLTPEQQAKRDADNEKARAQLLQRFSRSAQYRSASASSKATSKQATSTGESAPGEGQRTTLMARTAAMCEEMKAINAKLAAKKRVPPTAQP